MWTKIALIVSVLVNVCLCLTSVSLANRVLTLEHELHEARGERNDAIELQLRAKRLAEAVPMIQVSQAAPPIKVAVPMPRPKPTASTVTKPKPTVTKAKHRYREPRRVIKCSEVPMQAYWATSRQITDYMWKHGATRRQIRQVLTCAGKG